MRLLYLSPGLFDKGGITRYGRFQVRALRKIFGESAVIVFSLLGFNEGDFEDPILVDWAGEPKLSMTARIRFAMHSLYAAVRQHPQVVVSGHVNLGPLAYLIARLIGAKYVQNIYGLEVWSGLSQMRRMALGNADQVISDCHNTAERAFDLGLVGARPEVVWDCVDIDRYSPGGADYGALSKYGIHDRGRFRILFLSRLTDHAEYKGLLRLMDLVRALDERFELVIAGDGNQREYYRMEAQRRKISDRTLFAGSIQEQDLPELYRCADAFFLVSETGVGKGEGLPLTPIEAMACGVPALVGNNDGSREILLKGGGICTAPEDLERQRQYLDLLLVDNGLCMREGQEARRRAEEAFGYSRFLKETQGIFEDVVSRK